MKKRWFAWALLALVFTGCATTKPIWFIATPGYVEAQIATSESATRAQYESQIAALQRNLDAQRAVTDDLASLAEAISEIEQSNRELLDLADEVEDRLTDLPLETIRQLVNILEEHLASEGAQ